MESLIDKEDFTTETNGNESNDDPKALLVPTKVGNGAQSSDTTATSSVTDEEKDNSSPKRLQYTREELIKLSALPTSSVRPEFLDAELYKKIGMFRNPDLSYVKQGAGDEPKPAVQGRPPKPSNLKKAEASDGLILSPSTSFVTWGKGCGSSITQTSSSSITAANQLSEPNASFNSSRRNERQITGRVGSGRVIPRDEGRDWSGRSFESSTHRDFDSDRVNPRVGGGGGRFDNRNDNRSTDNRNDNRRTLSNSSSHQMARNGGGGGRNQGYDRGYGRNDGGRNHNGYHEEKEPEWMSEGPSSQLEFMELHGFDDDVPESKGSPGKKNVDKKVQREEIKPSRKQLEVAEASSKAETQSQPAAPVIVERKDDENDYSWMDSMLNESLRQITDDVDDDEVEPPTPNNANSGQSRFLELFSHQKGDGNAQVNSAGGDRRGSGWNASQMSPRGQQQQHENNHSSRSGQASESSGNRDLMQLLQRARINVGNLGSPNTSVPQVNIANATNLAELEAGMQQHSERPRQQQQQDGHQRQYDQMAQHARAMEQLAGLRNSDAGPNFQMLQQLQQQQQMQQSANQQQQHLVSYRSASPAGYPVNFPGMFANSQQQQQQSQHEQELLRIRRQAQELERRRALAAEQEQQRQFQSPSSIAHPFMPTSVIRKIAANKDVSLSDHLDRNSSQDTSNSFGGIRAITKQIPNSSEYENQRQHSLLQNQHSGNSSPLPLARPPPHLQPHQMNPNTARLMMNAAQQQHGFRPINGQGPQMMGPPALAGIAPHNPSVRPPTANLALMQQQLALLKQRGADPRQFTQAQDISSTMQQLFMNAASLQSAAPPQMSGIQSSAGMARHSGQASFGQHNRQGSDMVGHPSRYSPGSGSAISPQNMMSSQRNQSPMNLQRLFASGGGGGHDSGFQQGHGGHFPPVPLQQALTLEDLERQ